MKILVAQHAWYDYLDATIIQGLQHLGHEVLSVFPGLRTNYVERFIDHDKNGPVALSGGPADLFIQFIKGKGPYPDIPSVLCWGGDNQVGLEREFKDRKGFEHIFVRDHLYESPGHPINFGIEDRYYCAVRDNIKPLRDRSIDICFLGQLYPRRKKIVEQIRRDFGQFYNLVLDERTFNTPDTEWSQWTQPWAAHDPQYFETLADSKICLSLRGAGPDTGRTWECLASGAIPVVENYGMVDMVRPTPGGVKWWFGYDQLHRVLCEILANIGKHQDNQIDEWKWNQEWHGTKARAKYLLDVINKGNADTADKCIDNSVMLKDGDTTQSW